MANFQVGDISAEAEMFLKDEKGNDFCVPWAYGEKASVALAAAGFVFCRNAMMSGSFAFDALQIAFRDNDGKSRLDEALACVYGSSNRDALVSTLCMGDKRFQTLVLPKEVKVVIHDISEAQCDPSKAPLENFGIREYSEVLKKLARISGHVVHFQAESSGMKPPYPHEPNTLHVVTNSCPPGQVKARYVHSAYGKVIHARGLEVVAHGPSVGRGTVLKDELDEPMVQLLGNTWYLLIPTIGCFNAQTSVLIFERLLGEAWSAHLKEMKNPAKSEEATMETFGGAFSEGIGADSKLLEAELLQAEKRIAQLQEDLASAHRSRANLQRWVIFFRDPAMSRKTRKRMKEDWASIRSNPLVRRLSIVDKGLHVETGPINVTHDGYAYALGSFTVRVAMHGQVSVWNDAPTHHNGLAHPHINAEGHPCFGNAGTAITQAAGELRIADAVRYTLRWLSEGYTAALAEVKIENWPRAGESDAGYLQRVVFRVVFPLFEETFRERPMTDAERAAFREAIAKAEAVTEGTKLDAHSRAMLPSFIRKLKDLLADPPAFAEAVKEEEEKTDASA